MAADVARHRDKLSEAVQATPQLITSAGWGSAVGPAIIVASAYEGKMVSRADALASLQELVVAAQIEAGDFTLEGQAMASIFVLRCKGMLGPGTESVRSVSISSAAPSRVLSAA